MEIYISIIYYYNIHIMLQCGSLPAALVPLSGPECLVEITMLFVRPWYFYKQAALQVS